MAGDTIDCASAGALPPCAAPAPGTSSTAAAARPVRRSISDMCPSGKCWSYPGPTDAVQILEPGEHVARLGSIGWTEDSRVVQLINDTRCASVSNLQPALQQRGRAQLMLNDHLGRLTKEFVALTGLVAVRAPARRLHGLTRAHGFQDVGLRGRGLLGHDSLCLERGTTHGAAVVVPLHEMLGILAADVGTLHAGRLRLAWRNEEHVAVAEQRFRAHAVNDRAAVHLRRHAKRDPAREVGLDESRNDIHAGPLRREDQ